MHKELRNGIEQPYLKIFYFVFIFITSALLIFTYISDVNLVVKTDAYGNICENITLNYTKSQSPCVLSGNTNYRRSLYRFSLSNPDEAANLYDLTINISVFAKRNLDLLPSFHINAIMLQCGPLVLARTTMSNTEYIIQMAGLEETDSAEIYRAVEYNPQITISDSLLKDALLKLKIIKKILFFISFIILIMLVKEYKLSVLKVNKMFHHSRHHRDIIILFGVVLFYCLVAFYYLMGNPCYDNDEKYIMETAVGFLNTGELKLWDFVNNTAGQVYKRASIYTYMVAMAFKIFGVSVFTARAFSVICGAVFIFGLYLILRRLEFASAGSALTCILISLNSNLITLFRTARMYSLLMPLSLFMIYFGYQAVTQKNAFKKEKRFTRVIKNNFDFNLTYLTLFIITTLLTIWCVPNAILILFGPFLYVLYTAFLKKEKRYIIISLVSIVLLAFFVLLYALFLAGVITDAPFQIMQLLYIIKTHFHFSQTPKTAYVLSDLEGFGSSSLGIVLLILSIIFIWRQGKCTAKVNFHKYLCFILVGAYGYFVFFSDKTPTYRYMCFAQPISYILVAYFITEAVQSRYFKIWAGSYAILFAAFMYNSKMDTVYAGNYHVTNFIDAYNALRLQETSQKIVLFPCWYQSFYLQDFENVSLIRDYMFDERKAALRETFGGYNYNILLNSITQNTEGYLAFETRKLYHWKHTYAKTEKLFEKIAGTDFDTNCLELFKFRILYPVQETLSEHAREIIDNDNIQIYVVDKDNSASLYFVLKEPVDVSACELWSITLDIDGNMERFQLLVKDFSNIYVWESATIMNAEYYELADICKDK